MATVFTRGDVTQGTTPASSSTNVPIAIPARNVDDLIQVVVISTSDASLPLATNVVQYTKSLDVPGVVELFEKPVVTTSTVPATVNVRFASPGVPFTAFVQVVAGGAATSNPNQPSGNEALRSALLGISTGTASGLPFNSGVNPAGRGGRLGSPDGYEYLNDVVEAQRGVAFDVRAGFQYNNRNVSEGATAWNDLKGMQVLDWFDPAFPAVLGMPPFPAGGSYAAAAAGTYDAQYIAIGQTIAQKRPTGTGKVVLRWAWEFNFDSGVLGNKAQFIAAWRQAVTKIRQGAGDRVSFSWCPAASTSDLATLQALYPGDAYVDFIAEDTYDLGAGAPGGFHSQSDWLTRSGVGDVFAWAKSRGKLFSLDEWGGHNTGSYNDGRDNPDWQTIVLTWLRDNADFVGYECQFNEADSGTNVANNLWSTNGSPVQLPNARARHIQLVTSFKS